MSETAAGAQSRALYLRLISYVRPYWRPFAASVGGMVVSALTQPAVPALFKPVLDGEFFREGQQGLLWLPIALVALFFVRGLAGYTSQLAMTWVAGKLVLDLREAMFSRLLTLPASYYDRHPSGRIVSTFTYDVSQVTAAATRVLTVVVQDGLTVLGLLAWMFYLDWRLSLLSLIAAPLVALIARLINRRLRDLARRQQRTLGQLTQILEEATTSHTVIKLFGGQGFEAQRFGKAANWVRRLRFKSTAAGSAAGPLAQLVTVSALAVIVYLASWQVMQGSLTIGGFGSFLAAMGMLFSPLKRLTAINEDLQRGLAASETIFSMIDETSEPTAGRRLTVPPRGQIEFRDVTFSYPGSERPALDQFSLSIAPGETVALVGPSGSGKTTAARLLARFYDIDHGSLLLDGIDVRDIQLADLRASISFVSQDVLLFNDSIRANIAYALRGAADDARIREAARAAHALEFVAELPMGLDTPVGERGVRLSGGQRQRVAIARAFLKDAPILILDEATSSLDTESERHIQAALELLRRQRTTLVIAHRISTIENADRIVVMQRGKVLETGKHEDLLRRGGMYASLHRSGFGGGEPADAPSSGSRSGPVPSRA